MLGAQAANTKALVFNVKGEDLLFLDHPNRFLEAEDVDRYHLLHLPADRFPSVGMFAPPRRGDPNGTPEAERLVYRTLLRLAGEGRQVVVIAGNHDHRRRWAGGGRRADPPSRGRPQRGRPHQNPPPPIPAAGTGPDHRRARRR